MAANDRHDRLLALLEGDPQGARKLLEGLVSKKFIPHEGQRPVMDCQKRFMLMCAGRRFGKTKIAAALALRKARKERQMIWWVAPTYRIVKRGYTEVLRQLPENTLSRPAPPETAFDSGRAVILHFKNGSRMEFYSAERPEGMLGEGVDFAVLDEAALMPEHIWQQVVRPTLADRQGGALFISTPRGKNWFYRMYLSGQDELQEDYASWRFPSHTNPYIPQEEWEEMEQSMPRGLYEQEILADFISNSSAVFNPPDTAYRPIQEPKGHVVLGVDLAKHNDFTVFAGINSGNRQPCYHERFNQKSWPVVRQRLHLAVDEILQTAESITVMLDSTGIGDVVYDDLALEGLDVVPIKFTPQWKQMAVMLLAADLERGHAFLHEDQRNEFEGYTYTISEATGRFKYEAGSGHDDEVSAMLLAHWGIVNAGVPNVEMLTSSGPLMLGSGGERDEEFIDGSYEEEVVELSTPSPQQLLQNGWW